MRRHEQNCEVCMMYDEVTRLEKDDMPIPTFWHRRCQNGLAPTYLCDELCQPADTESRRRLRSASSMSLDVRRTRLSTVSDRTFPVAASRLWNSLPSRVTAAPPLSPFSAVVLNHISSHFLNPAFWLFSHLYSAHSVTCYFGHYKRFHIWHINELCCGIIIIDKYIC